MALEPRGCNEHIPSHVRIPMAGLQVDIYVSIGITWAAALVVLCMRMIARQMTRIRWWWDDYLSILAIVR